MNARDKGGPPPAEVFALELARLDRLIEREMLRLRARYELSLDELRGLYISDQQVEALLRHAPAYTSMTVPEAPVPEPNSRWQRLQFALDLERTELDLVLLALAPEIDAKYETLYAYLNNDVTRRAPTMELAQRLFCSDDAERAVVRAALQPTRPLLSAGLLELPVNGREVPRGQRGLKIASALADWLLGLPFDDERLHGVAALIEVRELCSAPTSVLAAGIEPDRPLLVFCASTSSEAAWAARRALAGRAGQVLSVDLLALRAAAAPNEVISALRLQQAVLGIGIAAAPLDALLDPDGKPLEIPCAALRRLAREARPLALAASHGVRWRDLLPDARALDVQLAELDAAGRLASWRAALGEQNVECSPDLDAGLAGLADRFVLSADRIGYACQHAVDLSRFGQVPLTAEHLYAAARSASAEGATGVTRPVSTTGDWDELVVPADVRARLFDVVRAVELRPIVFDGWGYARRPGARGIKVMFAGASGTGKTMAAAILARELGLDLYRIELAAVVSKYIGETEKNLDRAFVAARRANAILFIDEADALLGKRSEVKDAHDRYANVEIAYLLQRMEDHDGVVIVATNLANNIDPAFARRMQYVVQFPMPDIPSRERLWRGMFPPAAPLSDDLDFGFLARQFELAGGDIRNIALDAAFRAAHEGRAVGMAHLLTALVQQYVKRGKVPPTAELGEFACMLGRRGNDAGATEGLIDGTHA
jgi:hypothetical protein